ncbi:MAG: hypothetical protein AMS20_00220 [Gemmatimonas sp. SG8_28]|nr:MAG: hypothetical protein AMS20_00220 [Gemmatimonas sp. SG8_28]
MVSIEGNTRFLLFYRDRYYWYFDKWCNFADLRPIVVDPLRDLGEVDIAPHNGRILCQSPVDLLEVQPELANDYAWCPLDHQGGNSIASFPHDQEKVVYAIGDDTTGLPPFYDKPSAYRIPWLGEAHAHLACAALCNVLLARRYDPGH